MELSMEATSSYLNDYFSTCIHKVSTVSFIIMLATVVMVVWYNMMRLLLGLPLCDTVVSWCTYLLYLLNPSNAMAIIVQSTRMQRILKTI